MDDFRRIAVFKWVGSQDCGRCGQCQPSSRDKVLARRSARRRLRREDRGGSR